MKPFQKCIGCHSSMNPIKIEGNLVYQSCSKYCPTEFAQHYEKLGDEEITYFTFSSKKFHFGIYDKGFYGILGETVYVYSVAELKAHGSARPFIKIPLQNFKLSDISDPDKMEEKLNTLVLFL